MVTCAGGRRDARAAGISDAVIAAWMVASQRKFKRNWGFWLFLSSNLLWIVWGVADRAYALIVLQVALAALNIRGAVKNQT